VVIAYDDDDDAVRIANNSHLRTVGAVFGSHERALRGGPPDPDRHLLHQRRNYFSPDSPFGASNNPASAARWERPGWRNSWSQDLRGTSVEAAQ
jgi:hypothetical protein